MDGLTIGRGATSDSMGEALASVSSQSAGAPPRIAYLVHDLGDAAVRRRVDLLLTPRSSQGRSWDVRLAGFVRGQGNPIAVEGRDPAVLGRSKDGALATRALAVAMRMIAPGRLRQVIEGADTIIARNLEMLVLAAWLRKPSQRLVYECLDIHRLLLGSGLVTRLLHAIERWAMRRVDLVIVSAPAFREAYFRARRGWCGPIELVENRVQHAAGTADCGALAPPDLASVGPPWRIGWFGMLRCRRTLDALKQLAREKPGIIEVVVAGRPSPDIFPDLAAELASVPSFRFAGPYTAADLPGLYGQVHFAWSIDYFEEGLNSAWLLPNRLYECIAHGAVPIALSGVATGEWLAGHQAGMLLDDPSGQLPRMLAGLDAVGYEAMRAACAAIPRRAVVMDAADRCVVAVRIAGRA